MLRVIDIKQFDVVNGPDIRCSIWLSGCNNKCEGCWSPQTWDNNKGTPIIELWDKIDECINNPHIKGISILGGDPLFYLFNSIEKIRKGEENNTLKDLFLLLKKCHETKLSVWLWTGYTYEEIKQRCLTLGLWDSFVEYVDVLIEGRFELKNRDLTLMYRGSSNQRVIDLKNSVKRKQIIKVVE
nr:MAG TPA: anaerobic ribonucleoside-triphosphate reductase activating protein [Crassvirales sp.]